MNFLYYQEYDMHTSYSIWHNMLQFCCSIFGFQNSKNTNWICPAKNFDDAPLIVGDIDTFENFAVLPSSNLSGNLIIILISEQSRKTI